VQNFGIVNYLLIYLLTYSNKSICVSNVDTIIMHVNLELHVTKRVHLVRHISAQ